MNTLIAALIPFIAGLLIGGLLVWLLMPARRNRQRLEHETAEAKQALASYQNEVDRHFVTTARLVDDMTQAYRRVHEQLATGADALCSEESRQLVAEQNTLLHNGNESEADHAPSRPLDYAPSSQGTLSEDFGLTPETDDDTPTQDTAPVGAPRDYAEGCSDQGCSPTDTHPTTK